MFVENLTEQQVRDFVWWNVKGDIIKQFSPQNIEVGNYGKEWTAAYYSKSGHKRRTLHLTDDSVTPLTKKKMEDAWVRYLYSIFGEEYKDWYMEKKAELFV